MKKYTDYKIYAIQNYDIGSNIYTKLFYVENVEYPSTIMPIKSAQYYLGGKMNNNHQKGKNGFVFYDDYLEKNDTGTGLVNLVSISEDLAQRLVKVDNNNIKILSTQNNEFKDGLLFVARIVIYSLYSIAMAILLLWLGQFK